MVEDEYSPEMLFKKAAYMKRFVDNFIAEFDTAFGYKPVVLYSTKDFRGVVKPMPFSKIEEIVNGQLKIALSNDDEDYHPITSKTRKRTTIYYKHCTAKLMHDMGYTMTYIGRCLNMSHSTISVSITKIETFLSINDTVITSIYNILKYAIKEHQDNTIDNL